MARSVAAKRGVKPVRPLYVLDEQVGFILRQVWQRHSSIFTRDIGTNLTPTQWAALSKLAETGPCSQNQLGRLFAEVPGHPFEPLRQNRAQIFKSHANCGQ